jgi:CRP/FNR family transcriptional regulator, cyclic AMP receptor protein
MASDDELFQRFGKTIPSGTRLFEDGDHGDQMFIIQTGKVKIIKSFGDVEKTLAVLPEGEFFGEMAILNDEPRSAAAEVVEDAKLLVIDSKTFESMITGNGEIALRIIKKLTSRLQEADNQIAAMMIKDSNMKLVHAFKRMTRSGEKLESGGIKINASRDDLASHAGLPKDKVDEILGKIFRVGVVVEGEDGFVIPSVKKLDKFLEFLAMKEQFGDVG